MPPARRFAASADGNALETEIPFPGLAEAGSQLAVPLLLGGRLLGVLYVESPLRNSASPMRMKTQWWYWPASWRCASTSWRTARSTPSNRPQPSASSATHCGVSVAHRCSIRHFAADHSVFVDNDYLIKGVAGAIFWKLLREVETGRPSEFTNRELRLDASLKLPDITDNLDARLILLQRRLAERCPYLALEKTGRGRFRLNVGRPLRLSVAAPH
jgi:adenylate cyclase